MLSNGIVRDVVKLATGIYIQNIIGLTDVEGFSPNVLLLFKHFKKAYETKDITALQHTISEDLSCNFSGATNKEEFLKIMQYVFSTLPLGVNPHLVINLYQIASNTDEIFSCVINFKAVIKVALLPIPWQYDSGQMFIEAKPEGKLGLWRITHLTQDL